MSENNIDNNDYGMFLNSGIETCFAERKVFLPFFIVTVKVPFMNVLYALYVLSKRPLRFPEISVSTPFSEAAVQFRIAGESRKMHANSPAFI